MFTQEDKVISRVAKESREFVSDNLRTLFKLMLPLIPFIIICDIGELRIERHYPEYVRYYPFEYIYTILIGMLALSWHKLFLHGTSSEYKPSLLSLNQDDLKFLGVLVLLNIAATGISLISYFWSDTIIITFILLVCLVFLIWFGMRIGLYFPAVAYGEPMTLKQAYKNGVGLPGHLFFSSFLAVWRSFIVLNLILFFGFFCFLTLGLRHDSYATKMLLELVSLISAPIITALTVTVLSQYYLIWRKESSLEVR